MAALKHLASECKFKDGMLAERLRDRLIAGMHDDRMLRTLFSENLADLTFDKTVQMCVAKEKAGQDT